MQERKTGNVILMLIVPAYLQGMCISNLIQSITMEVWKIKNDNNIAFVQDIDETNNAMYEKNSREQVRKGLRA